MGGFIGAPSPELYARWIQVGALSPLFRTHTEVNTPDQEPWSYGERVEEISRNYIELRYRLLPYMYSLMYEASQTGAPPLRPLFWNDQRDEHAFDWGNQHQFLLGDNLMAAPVTNTRDWMKRAYLPEGRWLDWWTNTVYTGGNSVTVDAPLERMPMFLREGAIVPMRDVQQFCGEKKLERLLVVVFPSRRESRFELYEDDGESMKYERGEYRLTDWTLQTTDEGIKLAQSTPHAKFHPGARTIVVEVRGQGAAPGKVLLNNAELNAAASRYDAARQTLYVEFPDREAWQLVIR